MIILVTSLSCSLSVCLANSSPISIDQADSKSAEQSEKLMLLNAWARPSTSQNNNSAIYLEIKNDSNRQYNLVNWHADVANITELHDSFVNEKGISKMVKLDKLVIPPKTDTILKPGSTHIMLLKLKRPLNVGDKFNLILYFDDNTQETVEVEVK